MSDAEGGFDYCAHEWLRTTTPYGGWRKECIKCGEVLGGS